MVVESSDDEDVAAPPTDDYEDDEEDDDAAPAARQTRKRASADTGGGADDARPARPSKRTPRRTDEPDESDKKDKINVRRLTEADYNKPGASMAEKDETLIALLDACREGVFGDELRDCDVPKRCVVAENYPLGKHLKRRRDTFGSDPDADQKLLDAGFVPVSARSPAARADKAFERHKDVLRAAAADGLGPHATSELSKATHWLRERIGRARASDAADNLYLDFAKELGKLAPEDAKSGGRGNGAYWAHRLADQARAVLAGEDAAPLVPKKRKRSAAARAKPVKKTSKRRR